ncbi:hypothetical protein CICLE_v10006736mg, partial [Citrus x clementina]
PVKGLKSTSIAAGFVCGFLDPFLLPLACFFQLIGGPDKIQYPPIHD